MRQDLSEEIQRKDLATRTGPATLSGTRSHTHHQTLHRNAKKQRHWVVRMAEFLHKTHSYYFYRQFKAVRQRRCAAFINWQRCMNPYSLFIDREQENGIEYGD